MPTLIIETELRQMFDIHEDVEAKRLARHIGAASRRIVSIVGQAAYADALLATPTNADRKEDLKQAEASMALHYAILGLNTNVRAAGLVKTEKVEGDVVLQYLSPKETAEMSQLYLEQADEILRPWALTDGVPDAQVEIVETEED